jgi:DNA-directed RNA polymerase specialized sigma subunit
LHSKARLLAIDAFGRYDPGRAKLRTHLMSHLQGLRRASAQEQQIIGIPERVGLDLYKLRMGENELEDQLGRTPSDQELSEHLMLSRKRIRYIRNAQPGLSEGALMPEGDSGESSGIGPAVAGRQSDTWHDFVYQDLDPIDQVIMEHTTGLHNRPVLSKQQIAAKLKLSPGAISQRAAKIQEKLDKKDELKVNFF